MVLLESWRAALFFLNTRMQYYDGKVGRFIIGLWWGDKEYKVQSMSRTVQNMPRWPPCEKLPVPRTRCVRLGAITHQVPLVPLSASAFYDPLHCHTAAVSTASLYSDWFRQEFDGREWMGRNWEAAGMRWEAGLIWNGTLVYHSYYSWDDGHNFLCCGPHLTASSHMPTIVYYIIENKTIRMNRHCFHFITDCYKLFLFKSADGRNMFFYSHCANKGVISTFMSYPARE